MIVAAHYAKAEQALQADPVVMSMAMDVVKGVWNGSFSLDKLDMGVVNARFRQLDELNTERPRRYTGEHGFHLGAVKAAIVTEVNESIKAREALITMYDAAVAEGKDMSAVSETIERVRSERNSHAAA